MLHRPSLLLIRHAQSQNNAQEEQFRIPDPNITPLGVLQASKLATTVDKFRLTHLYCSPFLRSLETTRPIAERTGLTPFVRQDLYEQGGCHSGYQPGKRKAERGMQRAEMSHRYQGWILDERIEDDGWYELDHYESDQEAKERAIRVRKWFEDESTHLHRDRVAMVIHADFKMRLLEAFLCDRQSLDALGEIVNTSVSSLSYVEGNWKLDYWNLFTHLDPHEITS